MAPGEIGLLVLCLRRPQRQHPRLPQSLLVPNLRKLQLCLQARLKSQ